MPQLKRLVLSIAILLGISPDTFAQTGEVDNTTRQKNFTQKVHGRVLDAESKQPLPGVIVVTQSNNQLNAMTDNEGYFVISNVPVGRQSFLFQFVGYEPSTIPEVMVTSGKELESKPFQFIRHYRGRYQYVECKCFRNFRFLYRRIPGRNG